MSDEDNARNQARAQFESIREMVEALEAGSDSIDWDEEAKKLGFTLAEKEDEDGDTIEVWTKEGTGKEFDDAEEACCSVKEYLSDEDARQRIMEDPLSVQVRDGWRNPGEESEGPEEFEILLCTGGPAVRIIGEFGSYSEPSSAKIQYQDWFTPWTDWTGPEVPEDVEDVLLSYARVFYWGE